MEKKLELVKLSSKTARSIMAQVHLSSFQSVLRQSALCRSSLLISNKPKTVAKNN